MFEKYKKAIAEAREREQTSVLFLIYEYAKEQFYNNEMSTDEYNELKKMILGL